MVNEMLERIARALEPTAFKKTESLPWNEMDLEAEATVIQARIDARIAVQTIREPSEAMMRAAGEAVGPHHAKRIWQAICDEILK